MRRCSSCSPRIRRVFIVLRHVVRQPLRRQRVRPLRVLEREHAVEPHRSRSATACRRTRPRSRLGTQRSYRSIAGPSGWPSRIRSTSSRYCSRVCRRRIRCEHRWSSPTAPAGAGACRPPADRAPRRSADPRRAADAGSQSGSAARPARALTASSSAGKVARRIVGRLVVIDDLPEQLHLRAARCPPPRGRRRGSPPSPASARARACTGTTQKAQ